MPDVAGEPALLDAVAEANNWIPPLWRVLLSAGATGPAQDAQQVFLPSVSAGLYAVRTEAERRIGLLLDFAAGHPLLAQPARYADAAGAARQFLGGCDGAAYTADLNEYFMLDGADAESFLDQCTQLWQALQAAMADGDHAALGGLLQFDPANAALSLGLDTLHLPAAGADEVQIFQRKGKFGLKRPDGTVLLAPCADELFDFDGTGLAVARVGDRFGYLRQDGSWAVAPRFSDAYGHEHGMAVAALDGLYGYLDEDCAMAIAPRYLEAGEFAACGVAWVRTSEGQGLIDRRGHFVLAPAFSELEYRDTLQAWIGQRAAGDPFELFFEDGRPWFTSDCDELEELRFGGDALLRRDGLVGTWQRSGGPGLPVAFEKLSVLAEPDASSPGFSRTVYLAVPSKKARLAGAFLADGSVLIPAQYTKIEAWRVDAGSGQPTVEGQYDGVPQFFKVRRGARLFGVWSGGAGREILPCEFEKAWLLYDGKRVHMLLRRPGEGYHLYDEQGRQLSATAYEGLGPDPALEDDQYSAIMLAVQAAKDWAEERGALMWRGGEGWRLHADGREEADFDYQMRLALAGDAKACVMMAALFEGGRGVPADPVQVFYWISRAAAAGDEDARLMHAEFLEDGTGCRQDLAAARALYESLAPEKWRAAHSFACMLLNGQGGPQDQPRARAMLIELADRGEYCDALPQRNAGLCWLNGWGGPADRQAALDYFEKSARSNSYREADGVGCLLAGDLHGELALEASQAGERGAHAAAIRRSSKYYALAVENGCADGHLGLARLHLGEYGGARDDAAALACLRAALAEQNDEGDGDAEAVREGARALLREYGLRA
ncbi:hypothetical protein ASC94_04700 [Massilia sp. Root418]|uniref:tetratricopeptide repeat protein n=1 Tax=Massilia sp. Root418 TaxID=1736532 RepID=UPI0006F489B0|nr:tetratricopeptide repeat protein [Massilia sp. Root418]KQX01890.1 hypothetical protein ASC94_04700 [Massilia sp. Root418]